MQITIDSRRQLGNRIQGTERGLPLLCHNELAVNHSRAGCRRRSSRRRNQPETKLVARISAIHWINSDFPPGLADTEMAINDGLNALTGLSTRT